MKISKKLTTVLMLLVILALLPVGFSAARPKLGNRYIIKTKVDLTPDLIGEISSHAASVNFVLEEINCVAVNVPKGNLQKLEKLDYVELMEADGKVYALGETDYKDGLTTWNLDLINVADYWFDNWELEYDGSGVYIAILDTGFVKHWRDYFPEERIAEEYGKAFLSRTGISVPSEKVWERDTHSHGTHVTSTIIGYTLDGLQISGAAPLATIIPVKVLNNAGYGWDSAIAEGILYVTGLKLGPLSNYPVIISMSLGGPELSVVEKAAIDYAIANGVIIVAAAGNSGDVGMDYPGAYEPVISVGACGWQYEWWHPDPAEIPFRSWWYALPVPDPEPEVYITDFSGREKPGQDLDVVAPGSWVVGPFMPYGVTHPPPWSNGNPGEYYFVGGTSMSTPHVSGIVALMSQKYPSLTAAQAESILESTAWSISPATVDVLNPYGDYETFTWGSDATGAGLVLADEAIAATP